MRREISDIELSATEKLLRIPIPKPRLRRYLAMCTREPFGEACSFWLGYKGKGKGHQHGYANFQSKTWYAHRLFYHLFKEDVTNKMVLHKCPMDSDGRCVNLDHLYIGTRADNNGVDRLITGTYQYGEKNPCAKLTEEQVKEIRNLASEGFGSTFIASLYGLTQSGASSIIHRYTWKHI